jgi:amino acid transporter
MSSEKDQYALDISSGASADVKDVKYIVEAKGNATGEAADLYGDLGTAEEYGYVERG